eukprot:2708801-Rhodomonas_salina.2
MFAAKYVYMAMQTYMRMCAYMSAYLAMSTTRPASSSRESQEEKGAARPCKRYRGLWCAGECQWRGSAAPYSSPPPPPPPSLPPPPPRGNPRETCSEPLSQTWCCCCAVCMACALSRTTLRSHISNAMRHACESEPNGCVRGCVLRVLCASREARTCKPSHGRAS